MTVYAPGTLESDPQKQNMALQQQGSAISTLQDDVTSLQTPNYGLVNSGGALGVSLSTITASLGADVALNAATYTDGPSIAQGTTGTWDVKATVTVLDTATARDISFKLWDGTTVIDSARISTSGANFYGTVSLLGCLASPAANIKVSAITSAGTTASFKFNGSGNSKDCTITAVRIS